MTDLEAALSGDVLAAERLLARWEATLVLVLRTNKAIALAELRDELDKADKLIERSTLHLGCRVLTVFDLVDRISRGLAEVNPANLATSLQNRSHCRTILEELAAAEESGLGGLPVSELVNTLGITRPNLSMQLAFLENLDAVAREHQGKAVQVSLRGPGRQYAIDQGWLPPPTLKIEKSAFPSRTLHPMKSPARSFAER